MPGGPGGKLILTQQKQEFQKIPKAQHNREGRDIFICHALFYSYTLWVHKINCLGMFATCESIPGAVKQEDETIAFLYWYNFLPLLFTSERHLKPAKKSGAGCMSKAIEDTHGPANRRGLSK